MRRMSFSDKSEKEGSSGKKEEGIDRVGVWSHHQSPHCWRRGPPADVLVTYGARLGMERLPGVQRFLKTCGYVRLQVRLVRLRFMAERRGCSPCSDLPEQNQTLCLWKSVIRKSLLRLQVWCHLSCRRQRVGGASEAPSTVSLSCY